MSDTELCSPSLVAIPPEQRASLIRGAIGPIMPALRTRGSCGRRF